jgi:hypothetical protein
MLLLVLSCCGGQEQRPEGIVERWLLALNQGSAGRPGRYAPASVSDAVLPDWQNLDPGEFDVIEVGRADRQVGNTCSEGEAVLFRVVPLDGAEKVAAACVAGSRVTELIGLGGLQTGAIFPSEGGASITDVQISDWLFAAGIALVILLVSELLMRLVRPHESG